MGLINEMTGVGRTVTGTIILGIILWMLIKRLPNHNSKQDFGMYFDLLIVLGIVQLFFIIYISLTDYTSIFKKAFDQDASSEVQEKKDLLYDIWDWMYPGHEEKGIKLDIFMFLLYIIIVIITILIILLRLTDEGELKVENFENPLSFGICFLKENGYTIFVYMNIFMFFYITRFIMKEINILSPDETKICPESHRSNCFTSDEIANYSKITDCNNNLKELKCEDDNKSKPYILKGCEEIEPGHLKFVYNNQKLDIIYEDNKLNLDNSNIVDLGLECSASINMLLNNFTIIQ